MSFGIGEVVDHYRVERVIAHSPTITVYEAFDLRLLRRVALKELAAGLSEDPVFRARFARDAARAAQLDHPGIASVFDSNDHDGSLYFVTKYVDGVTLQELVRTRPIPVDEAMPYLEQVAAALDYAHRHGVVHGNVGMATVLVGGDGGAATATLFDVGISKRSQDEDVSAAWFPPAAGEWSPTGPAADAESRRVDLVGLARMAFELLTRRAPQDALASASMLEPALPVAVDEVFAAVFGDNRDMTCAAFVVALRRAMPASLLVRRPPPTQAIVAVPPPPLPTQPARTSVVGEGGGHRRLLLVGASLVAVLLVGGVLLWQGTRSTGASREGAPRASAVSLPAPPTTLARTTTSSSSTTSSTSTTSTSTTSTSTTSTTVAVTEPPTEPPTSAAPVLSLFGDVVGQPVTAPANPEGRAAVALQQRRPPAEVAAPDTPASWYAEWLRLTTPVPTTPVLATNDGYAIDAGIPVELNQFQVADSGQVVSFVECTGGTCTSATGGIQLSPFCEPSPGCDALASDDGTILAVLRATVNLRAPAVTLIFSVTSSGLPVVAVNDPYNTVHYDGETGAMSLTLAAGPPPGTQSSVTLTYEDGSRTSMTITYG